MRLLFVHSSNELYGADVVLLTLLRRLDKGRFSPLVILPCDVPYEGLLSQELEAAGILYRVFDQAVLRRMYLRPLGIAKYAGRLLRSTVWLAKLIRRERIDVVHSNTSAVLSGALAAKITGVPNVWHVHEIITEPRLVWRWTSRLINRLSDRVVAVSSAVAEHLAAASPTVRRKLTVIHNRIDVEAFRPDTNGDAVRREFGVRPTDVLVGMVARVSHWKGQEQLLQAAAEVVRRCPQTRVALVGGTFQGQEYRLERLHSMVQSLGLQRRVVISGFRRDIHQVWAALDVVVSPSIQPDPFPTSVLEAMASAKPVIATAHGGPTEMVVDGETGLLVPPGDVNALSEAIVTLIENEGVRKAMGAAGRKRVEEHFSVTRFVRHFEELYDSLGSRSS